LEVSAAERCGSTCVARLESWRWGLSHG
jgi:hypothetical protein